ncbi:MAG: hypothetical protein RMJ33_09635 [Saprospiraceae bacterium]|nr:DUF4348 domain-containing protein [Saprospiraceae bacterium]MDW8230086.1 hypothetical protein [Saprospiraceae bacterium]
MRFLLPGIALLPLLFTACRQPATPPSSTLSAAADIPADFLAFYRQFHADSLFQVQHISWPLPGQTTEETPDGALHRKSTYWERENWRFQRAVDFSTGEYRQQLRAVEGQYVVETISYAAAPNYALERRFMRRTDGAWELVYYADMQER